MAAVSSQDLLDLLTVLYQGSVQRSPLAVPPAPLDFHAGPSGVGKSPPPFTARFFRRTDLEALADAYSLPLPSSGIEETLAVGVSRGVFQRALELGTQCGAGQPCDPTEPMPVVVYAYNPNMTTVNPRNEELLVLNLRNLGVVAPAQALYRPTVQGSVVRFSNNRAPCYGTRGYATWTRYPYPNRAATASARCCPR